MNLRSGPGMTVFFRSLSFALSLAAWQSIVDLIFFKRCHAYVL
jgi:hypothetical protein